MKLYCVSLLILAITSLVCNVEALLTNCSMTCDISKSTPNMFEKDGEKMRTFAAGCKVQTSDQTKNCTLDISELVETSCNKNDDIVHYIMLKCINVQRIVITNQQNTYCNNYVGFLHVKECGIFWQDLELYAEWLHLNVLYLEDYTDYWSEEIETTTYWANYIDSKTIEDNITNVTEHLEPLLVPTGLREVGTLNLAKTDHIPEIFKDFLWPLMAEIQIIDDDLLHHVIDDFLQKTFPKLQTLELIGCNLTLPPSTFPWRDKHLKLPGNLSRTEMLNTHYSEAIDVSVERNCYRRILLLDRNIITNLSNFTFHGNLHQISLQKNHLSKLNENLFVNMEGLNSIYLSDNDLTTTPAGLFRGQTSLFAIYLANNLITDIPHGLFHNMPSLRKVDLSGNLIKFIQSETFLNIPVLQSINLAANQIQYVSDDAIAYSQTSLESIDLSENNLTIIPAFIFLLRKLHSSDLSRNQITFDSMTESLENITHEHLHFAQRRTASGFEEELSSEPTSTKNLLFHNNNISTIDIDSMSNKTLLLVSYIFHYFKVDLKGNDFACDCKVYPFYNQMHGTSKLEFMRGKVNEYNKNNFFCRRPPHLNGKLLYNLDPSDFNCEEKIQMCPDHCRCYRRSVDDAVIVSCQQVEMTAIPPIVPEGTIDLDLSGNLITTLDKAYPYLIWLERLNLQNNLLSSISIDVLDFLERSDLRELKLDNNRLRHIPENTYFFKDGNLSSLTLGNNPWECNCHSSWMKNWLIVWRDIIQDLDEVMCVTGVAAGNVYVEVTEDQFICITPPAIIVRNALLAVTAVFVLLGIAITLVYVYRGEIKILMYVHCNWHPFDSAEEADMLDMTYDAFISYSGLDYKWVCFDLLPKLENHSCPYRICVHDRDFMPGAYIEDNIMEAVRRSRRMILVLSQNYLKSDWCMLEFRAAHNKVLNERTNYLILVLCDGVNVNDLDEDMQLYIRTNTYLARSNKWFYDKLFYSMPTKNLVALRRDMETKTGKVAQNPALDFTYDYEKGGSSSKCSMETETSLVGESGHVH